MTIRGYSPLALLSAALLALGLLTAVLGLAGNHALTLAMGAVLVLASVPAAILSVLDG